MALVLAERQSASRGAETPYHGLNQRFGLRVILATTHSALAGSSLLGHC